MAAAPRRTTLDERSGERRPPRVFVQTQGWTEAIGAGPTSCATRGGRSLSTHTSRAQIQTTKDVYRTVVLYWVCGDKRQVFGVFSHPRRARAPSSSLCGDGSTLSPLVFIAASFELLTSRSRRSTAYALIVSTGAALPRASCEEDEEAAAREDKKHQ